MWNPVPASRSVKPFIPFCRPRVDTILEGVFLSEELLGVNVHFIESATRPCSGQGACDYCDLGLPSRFQTYSYVLRIPTCRVEILCLPALASMYIEDQMEQFGSLLGRPFKAQRSGRSNRSRVLIKVGDCGKLPPYQPRKLPKLTDLLLHIWSVNGGGD